MKAPDRSTRRTPVPTSAPDPIPPAKGGRPVQPKPGGSSPILITWWDVERAAEVLAARHKALNVGHKAVWGIPTGGSVVAPFVAEAMGLPVTSDPSKATLIVDDLVDSGKTLRHHAQAHNGVEGFGGAFVDALFRKPHSPENLARGAVQVDGWLHFPWEQAAQPEDAVVRLLEFIGEDPNRDGLRDTPARVCRAWREMTAGYQEDPQAILGTVFEEPYDEMIVVRDIPFCSNCEHHMLPFVGTVDVGYIPGKVVGLSKIARLVDCFARRLQIQEKFTRQIADALQVHLEARGVAVVVKASHMCMSCRGVKKSGAVMTTSCMLGALREKPEARQEFLALCRG